VDQGIAVLGMKPMAAGSIPRNNLATGIECLHYALNLPTSVVITGCNDQKTLDQAFEAARTFKPLSQSELSALLAKTREAALSGKYETFKTTSQADGTSRNPQWMG
jgi:hypothetical protein